MSSLEALLKLSDITSCAFDRQLLDCTYGWLNDPEVLLLIDANPVDRNSQLKWFDTLSSRSDFIIRGIRYKGVPIGVFGLKNVLAGKGEYWGYIGAKQHWGKGIGSWMMNKAIELAEEHQVQSLYLKVLVTNERAVRLYKKSGFHLKEFLDEGKTLLMEHNG